LNDRFAEDGSGAFEKQAIMSTITMNTTIEFEQRVLKTLDEISEQISHLSSLPKNTTSPEKKVRKARNPDAKPNPWITFTGQVRTWLNEGIESGDVPKGAAGRQCQQFCKFLKEAHGEATYSLGKEQVLSAHASWNPPILSSESKPKPKPKVKPAPETESESESKSKPRKPMSEATKAAAAAKRRATLASKKSSEPTSAPTSNAAASSAPASAPAPTREVNWKPISLNKVKYLWDPVSNAIFYRNEDNSKGTWAGVFDVATKKIDTSVKEFDPAA
jgi:hypothetical protein